MDESLTRALRQVGLAACCVALVASAGAADLPDPTRPPAALAAVAPADGGASEIERPVLQSVMISPARRVAIISGQAVVLGAMYQGARLIKVTGGEAVLRSGKETQTLKLFPDLHKQPVSSRGAVAATSTPVPGPGVNRSR